METIEAIKTRRSIRKYKDTPVDKELVKELIELAAWAPSAMNIQPWAFLVLEGKEYLKELSTKAKELMLANIDKRPELKKYQKRLEDENYNVFHNASTVVAIYGSTDTSWYIYDCSLAAQNFMLAAHDKGLGTCWIGFAHFLFDSEEFKQKHNIPEKYRIVAPFTLGYPEKQPASGPARKDYPVFGL
ncbi:MAG: nitroreductase [Desulfotomaculum sp.]|nr:nitroreductase [Desulfotomaculum sp.]